MRITQENNVVVITIITAFVLTALWPMRASTARLKANEGFPPGEAPSLAALTAPDEPTRLRANEAYGKLPLSFEANQGQTDARVKFISRGAGYNLFLTSTEAVLSLDATRRHGDTETRREEIPNQKSKIKNLKSATLRMKLVGANPTPRIEGSDELPGKSNYFIGNNPKKWRTNVSAFARVQYREVYPGVDVVYYGNQRQMENDFVVAPGTNPGVIAIAFDGANKISVDQDGSLVLGLKTGASGDVRLQKPVIYQLLDGVRHEVAGNYVMRNRREVGFEVGAYDLTRPLVIDPVLVYSTYLGGNHADRDDAIAVDASGNAYVLGTTASTDFPGATPPQHGGDDITVVKFNAAGSALLYSTYLGGSSSEFGADIAVDGAGNAYVTGQTTSLDFPVTAATALQPTKSTNNTVDASFVTRLNPAGSALVYSTYLSGNFGARGWGIATDGFGNAYVTGTTSTGFPVTAGAFETMNFNSGFMTKLNTNATSGALSLVYSTFLAHIGSAEGRAIAADAIGNVYVTGNTNSTANDFATPGAFQTTYGLGSSDAFVEKFNTNVSGAASRVYATYLGGSGKDIGSVDGNGGPGKAIAIDASGNAYIAGSTGSTNFPLRNASQSVIGGQNDAFLTKLNATGSDLIYSTYLGGTGDDFGRSVAVNVAGGAYVTGAAGPNFPTLNALPTPFASVGFVTKFTPSGAVLYSTLLSGVTASTGSFGIAVDGAGNAFATGGTNGNIVTAGAFQINDGSGGTTGWVTVIADPTIIGRVLDENGNPLVGATVNLTGVPTATTTTDANGGYTFGLLTVGNSYTVSVVAPNYIFVSAAANNLQKNVRLDFGPTVISISGQVTLNASGLSGVTMALSGGKALSAMTSGTGNYSHGNLPAGRNYTVTPTMSNFQFTPTSSTFNNVLSDQTANFTATAIPPTIQFSSSTYTISEAGPRVDITLTRSGDTTASASVNYATNDAASLTNCNVFNGIASPRCDYTNTLGTMSFAAGETSKMFSVAIVDDAYAEGNETFTIGLNSPSGATLGAQSTATVTIIDNDAVNGANPIDSTGFFVRQQYIDFLGREPDPPGFAGWTATINNCTGDTTQCDRIHVSQLFFQSAEFQDRGYFVYRFYPVAFGRKPDYAEFVPDLASVSGFLDATQLEAAKVAFIAGFMARPAFANTYNPLTNQQYVDMLLNTAGVTLSSRQSMIDGLNNATLTRARVLRQIVESTEVSNKYNHQAYAVMEYFGYLRRQPDAFYLQWIAALDSNNDPRGMVIGFATSTEYRQRFGP